MGRQTLHLYRPIQILMPLFLEASAARNGGVFATFLSESVNLCSRSHHMERSILVSDFLTTVYKG
jgi:hypothetical protein